MVAFGDLFALPTRSQIKARLLLIAQALEPAADGTFIDPPLPVTAWVPGGPSERWLEIIPRAIDAFLSNITTQAVRAFFLDFATDPGDPGDLSADQTPRPGWLSALGAGWYGVLRGGATFAAGFLTVTNAGNTPAVFSAFDLTFRRNVAGADGGYPTYRNTADGAIYTGLGETKTLLPGASVTIPIIAEQIGTQANATPGEISVVVTQSFGGSLTCTNASPVLGSEREDRALYISRCKLQSAAASPNGAQDAYRYAATTGADGLPLQLGDGSGPTTVNRVFVSPDSSTGVVLIYLANPSGPATSAEVSSANGNINGITIVDDGQVYNPRPIGVRPDTVTLGPTIADPVTGADGPAAAVATGMKPSGTARIKALPGQSAAELITDAQTAIADSLAAFFSSPVDAPIGGVDQVAGAGVIYTSDVQDAIKDAFEGLYAVSIVILGGGGSSTAIALGHVPTFIGAPAVTAVGATGGGAIKLTVTSTATLSSGYVLQVYDVEVGGGSGDWLSGIYTISVIDGTNISLNGTTFPGGGTLTRARLSHIRITVT